MNDDKLKNIIEAALLAAGRPMTLDNLLDLFADDLDKPDRKQIKQAIETLCQEWAPRALEINEVASGYRFQVKRDLAHWMHRLWSERPARYSRALLETLAIIAYRQPVTRGEIEEIRGVGVSQSIVKTLTEREWIKVIGHREVPGRPAIYGTTKAFLDNFGLQSLESLPPLAEIRDLERIHSDLFDMAQTTEGENRQPAADDGGAASDDAIVEADMGAGANVDVLPTDPDDSAKIITLAPELVGEGRSSPNDHEEENAATPVPEPEVPSGGLH